MGKSKFKKLCAWCGKKLIESTEYDSEPENSNIITHGICNDCRKRVLAQMGLPLKEFLDLLPAPVLLVDSDVKVKTANLHARSIIQKDIREIEGYKGGDVFECSYASQPGGCGQTIHCSGCAIRISVTDTYKTGKSLLKIPACLQKKSLGDSYDLHCFISTEKIGEFVLLRIDSIGGQH